VIAERGVVHVSNLLGNIVDFEESQHETTMVIRSGVSEALDAARERYEDLDNVWQWQRVDYLSSSNKFVCRS
jgi:hypothetical protein